MSSKKQSNKRNNNEFPYKSEIKQMKYEFNKMINNMPDEEFIDFLMLFLNFIDLMDDGFDINDFLDEYENDDIDTYDEDDMPF